MGELRILGRTTSINVRKVLWTADLIGVDYVQEVWGKPDRDPNVPEYLALNPNAQVPTIVEDGFVLWESNAIMRHLCEVHRSGLFPADFRERARVDQWLTWQAAELPVKWHYAVYALLRRAPGYTDESRIAASIERWNAAMQILEAQLAKGQGYVVNDRVSLADIALAVAEHRWFSIEFAKPELPAVRRHYELMRATPEGEKYVSARTP